MSFLNWWMVPLAAGLTIPPLIALYFLKLKREVRVVPTTLLWKRAVEDLHVNSPFQRLRSSLLLFLQLLILILAAIALGKPMFEQADSYHETVIIMIDQSASMNVTEEGGSTRLDKAKEEAKKAIDNLDNDARTMVIAFCDRPSVVASFGSDKRAIQEQIDSIKQTDSSTQLGEAIRLAESYAQNVMIGTSTAGQDVAPDPVSPNATVFVFTDGRIADGDRVTLQKFDAAKMIVRNVGVRNDNVGILAMAARRNYEYSNIVEVAATIRNFGPETAKFDATLRLDGEIVDIQSVVLSPGVLPESAEGEDSLPLTEGSPPPGSQAVCAFDELEMGGGGTLEVSLSLSDALQADNRAWTVIGEPRAVKILLVAEGNFFMTNALDALDMEYDVMTPLEYEEAADELIQESDRAIYDVVIFDGHDTNRLPQGNYMFWGGVPRIEGVSTKGTVEGEVIFNWDDTHPVLRYVTADAIWVAEWLRLVLPSDAVTIMDGETSPVMSYLSRDASQFMIIAFPLMIEDESGQLMWNTYWPAQPDFVMFMQNSIQYLASNVITTGKKSLFPGEPIVVPIPSGSASASIRRPDNGVDRIPASGYDTVQYARTRDVGVYEVSEAEDGKGLFAVNLFDPIESRVEPAEQVDIGAAVVQTQSGETRTNRPAWSWFLLAVLGVLVFEWIVYNLRIFV